MAILALTTTQKDGTTRKRPFDDHGKLRFDYFELPAVAVAGDIDTTIDLCDLPPGAVRILPGLSRLKVSAFGASRTLDVGHRAYQNADGAAVVAESEAEFITARDVSSATDAAWSTTVLKYDLFSKAGITLFATVEGGTIPIGATLSGLVAYLYE